ncbi:MAG: hypothetical protein K0R39_1665 [Symbiobacteriaceae bacterium]|nr:hypothetical protein [Symbiobacteriaceae bacterium]
MSLLDLQAAFQKQADSSGTISVSAAVIADAGLTPRTGFDTLLQSYLKVTGALTVTTRTIPAPTATQLTVSGTVSLLGLSGVAATLEFLLGTDGKTIDLRMGVTLGDQWTFASSFALLVGYPFNQLVLSGSNYAFTTAPTDTFTWNQQPIAIVQGLNVVSSLALTGALGILLQVLEDVTASDQVIFSGSIDPSGLLDIATGYPNLALSGSIAKELVAIPNFALSNPRIGLTCAPGDSGQDVWLSFITTLSVDGQPFFDFKAALLQDAVTLAFGIVPDPTKPITPANIIELLGGSDYTQAIPPEFESIFEAVALKGLSASLQVSTLTFISCSAAIGSSGPWQMGQFQIDDLTLRYTLLRPFTSRSATLFNFSATAELYPNIFQGLFTVEINYDLTSSAMAIAAGFKGSVSLNTLVDELSNHTVTIPSQFVEIEFTDFGMTFSEASDSTYNWSMYGNADANFDIPALGGKFTTDFHVYVTSNNGTMSYLLKGGLGIGNSYFEVSADLGATQKVLTGSWTALNDSYLEIADICTVLGFEAPAIPPDLDLGLDYAALIYDLTDNVVIFEADSVNYGAADFVGLKSNGQWIFFFGIGVKPTINLSNLPLIQTVLGPDSTVEIGHIQFVIASGAIDAKTAGIVNGLIKSGYPKVPDAGIAGGVGVSMNLQAGQQSIPLSIGTDSGTQTQGGGGDNGGGSAMVDNNSQSPNVAPVPATASDGTVWFTLQKTFGPITFQKVGIRYTTDNGESILWFLMNASLSTGGLTIGVVGLGAGSPLTTFDPHFTISGINITLQEGPVTISGGLLGTLEPEINFYGELLIGTPEFTIAGLGGYAQTDGQPSFFVYAVLDMPIGGPPYFFVTGLAGGVGYNRKLLIPDVSGVATFPLVQWAVGTGNPPGMDTTGNIGQQVNDVLTRLSQAGVIAPSVGDYWLAAGIRFTSFELVDSFALLTLVFGTQFEVALLGLSTVSLPPGPVPVAYAQLELKASFSTSSGLMGISGQLTPQSYVLSKDAHLTGGFAFYVWFTGEHAGDFVATLGGYSPKFSPPSHYPQVPRLGLNWRVVPELTIKGDLYFALTSAAIMAGGSMSATWESGGIKAWFSVEADFLMVFQPFHYYISAGVQLGASFRINLLFTHVTMTIHLGVDLEVWGPDFTGKATIDLSIISFTISFGSSGKQTTTTIAWSDFVTQLLPGGATSQKNKSTSLTASAATSDSNTQPIVGLVVSKGLLKQLSDKDGDLNFVVSGELCELTTQTAIPAKDYAFSANLTLAPDALQPHDANGQLIQPNSNFGVGPSGIGSDQFTSTHTVTITSNEDSTFLAVRVLNNAPSALWQTRSFDKHGVPSGVDPLNDTTVPNTVAGYRLVPYVPAPDHTLPISLEYLQYTIDENIQHFAWSAPTYPTTDSFSNETVSGTIASATAEANRSQLLAAMVAADLQISTQLDVSDLANPATNYLLAAPVLRLLGEQR